MTVLEPRLFEVHQYELTSDDYYTPAWVFDRMGIDFDLDVCAPPGGIPWIPAARYFDMAADGLARPWEGRVWMNPPYSDAAPWASRFIEHGNGVALIQFCRARWFHLLWDKADGVTSCLTPTGSMFQFIRGNDGEMTNVYMPVGFAAFGEECVEAISRLGRVRR